MSVTQTDVELRENSRERGSGSLHGPEDINSTGSEAPASAFEAIPNGGYGWVVVAACSMVTFMINGWSGSWGVLQTALFQNYPSRESTTSLSFIGFVSIALCVALGLVSVRLSRLIGARYSMLLGVLLMSFGIIFSGFTIDRLGGLFATAGVSFGLGGSLAYTMSNTLPVQWFGSRLGTANGLVKLGGGIGATVLAVVVQALIDKVGIPWTFRIIGLISLASGVPAALLIKERAQPGATAFVDFSLFKSMPFCCIFLAGAVGTFALFVPPFFLPLFAHSIGLSASTGAAIVACFNACTAVGRLGAGFACDKFGSTNMLLLTMALNAVSMLAIWPVSETIGPLAVFAALNGIANGAFFVTMPTAIGRMTESGQAAVGMGMAITGWTGGYLMGSPIAGMLIAATGAERAHSVVPYRAAIFYEVDQENVRKAQGIATKSNYIYLLKAPPHPRKPPSLKKPKEKTKEPSQNSTTFPLFQKRNSTLPTSKSTPLTPPIKQTMKPTSLLSLSTLLLATTMPTAFAVPKPNTAIASCAKIGA